MSSFSFCVASSTSFLCSVSAAASTAAFEPLSEASAASASAVRAASPSARDAMRFFSSSISRSRPIRLNSRFCTLPPVMEPPGLMMSPFTVAIRNAPRARLLTAMPASRSRTMTVRPSRFSNTPLYFASYPTSSEATPKKPSTRQASRSFASNVRGRIAEMGNNVARPYSLRRRYSITYFASCSVGVTMFCNADPSAISTAVSYSFGTRISSATTPSIRFFNSKSRPLSRSTLRTLA